jgi:WD40 repeat protein
MKNNISVNRIAILLMMVTDLVFGSAIKKHGILSIDTQYTINKVRTAIYKKETRVIASSYEGTVLALDYKGEILWEHKLSGFMNHDVWTGDLDNDGNDEILAANADGSIYCLDRKGKLLWSFKQNNAPMYAVCIIKKQDKTYVVCGGYDNSIYYVSSKGKLIKEIPSKGYSIEKSYSKRKDAILPDAGNHLANFLRPMKQGDGTEILVVHGAQHSMNGGGSLYLFNPLESKPIKTIKIKARTPNGDIRIVDANNDGYGEVLLGLSGVTAKGLGFTIIDSKRGTQNFLDLKKVKKKKRDMYTVTQTELIDTPIGKAYFILTGRNIVISPINGGVSQAKAYVGDYSYNDMFKDPNSNTIILASAQSGGSAIHILNLDNSSWGEEFSALKPIGNIQKIIDNTTVIRDQLKEYKKPVEQTASTLVYFMTEKDTDPVVKSTIKNIQKKYKNPIFLDGGNFNKEKYDRSSITNEIYRNKRDGRMTYNLSQKDILNKLEKRYERTSYGISYWGGHGNDPFMYQLSTTQKALDLAKGKKTVLVYPEMEDHTKEFDYVMNNMLLPLADYAKDKKGIIFLRNKHVFWQSSVYLPTWKPLLSGRYADVMVPSMEETTDKSMELSLAARMGLWTSGVVNSWGARSVRDNASFDRLRQHSNQMLPNHFLKTMVYTISSGAQYINNFSVDQRYMSLLWDLIAQGVLYVPKRSDILSFSPVHLSMTAPDEHYLNEGNNVKWTTFYKKGETEKEPYVFSRLNGTWPGAPVTEWDFSRYAAGVKERRMNFIPPYKNGMVLITPPQNGVFSDKDAVRKPLVGNLHPYYKNIMKEYISDGKNYISSDGKQTYKADEYYKIIEKDIQENASLLPIIVSGNVGWVVAQVSPKHLRLTLVENGFVNPKEAKAVVKFNTIKPKNIKDLLSGETFILNKSRKVEIGLPLGTFRFIDIELRDAL